MVVRFAGEWETPAPIELEDQEENVKMDSSRTSEYVAQRRAEIGQNLRDWRRKLGWTQEEVAQHIGCSRKRINRVEKGHVELAVGELELLAKVLNTDFLQLISPAVNWDYLVPSSP